ncbi:MAG: hypothetical protein K5779_10515 [Saccharofermentans sp.]|nr:hypothetical protein [Saccharofermentans sp.]
MAADVRFTVKKAVDEQALVPANINEDLEKKFIKKSRSSSIKLIPVSLLVAAIVIVIMFLLIYFLRLVAISTIGFLCVIFPIYAVYDAFATSKVLKNHDYEFFYGEVVGKTDNGNYQIRGLDELKISILFGKKEYYAGERVIISRLKDELHLISEE